jgi:hypothetical protein
MFNGWGGVHQNQAAAPFSLMRQPTTVRQTPPHLDEGVVGVTLEPLAPQPVVPRVLQQLLVIAVRYVEWKKQT